MTKLNINESHYLNLRASAVARLAVLRNAAAYTNAPDVNLPPSMQYATWREARRTTFLTQDNGFWQGYNGSEGGKRCPVWYTHDQREYFRNERNADDVDGARIDHKGWYSDADCCETVRGIVACLNHGRFIAGYLMSMNGERVYFAKVFDCEKEAAQYADGEAEKLAESEREYNERYQEAQALTDRIDDLKRDLRRRLKVRHMDGFDSAADYRELEETIAELRKAKADLSDNYADIEI